MRYMGNYISQHLRKPSTGFWGYVTKKILVAKNTQLEHATFDKLEVKTSDNVLELGFGYGEGLSYALDKVLRLGTGDLMGVDYSSTACDSVTNLLKSDIESGKLQIFNADVAKMPIDDDTVDKVFHTNCFYFWPDKKAAALEILRVMKPGGLMIAGMNVKSVESAANGGWIRDAEWQPETYLDALRAAGFSDVHKDTKFVESIGAEISFLFGAKPFKIG